MHPSNVLLLRSRCLLASLWLTLTCVHVTLPCQAQPAAATSYTELAVEHTRAAGADVFAIDPAANIWHLWQTDKTGAWTANEALDGLAKDIAVVARDDGRFEVFVIGNDDAVWHDVQQKKGWSGWQSLGGSAKRIAVAKSKAGRFGLFIIGSDDAVWRSFRTGPRGTFGPWKSLGGFSKRIAVAEAEAGNFRVFAIGSDDAIHHRSTGTGEWQSLGGNARAIAVTRQSGGKLEVFHVGTDAAIWHARQTGRGPSFGSWESLGGDASRCAINTAADVRATLVTLSSDGRTFAYATATRTKAAAVRGWSDLKAERSVTATDSRFSGRAYVDIPDLHVSESRNVELGLHFDPANSQVTITNFPPLVTKPFHTPFGNSVCTVTLIGGGTGSFDRAAGQLAIPVTLKFDQSLDVPGVQEDARLELELRSDRQGGAALDASSGKAILAGEGAFQGNGAINPLKHKKCQMRIDGQVSPVP